MKKIQVLMLGWEFPPVISGGLGIACYGLGKHLSKLVDLTLILPKTDPKFLMEKTNILGLNNIDLDNLISPKMVEKTIPTATLRSIEQTIEIDPYYFEKNILKEVHTSVVTERIRLGKIIDNESESNLFEKEELYGEGLINRVIMYSKYVQELAEDLEFDIIHAHDWMTYLAGLDIKKRTGKPLVLHVHSLDYDRAGADSRGWVFDLERHALHQADLVIPVSHYTGNILSNHYGLKQDKLLPVHNGIEPLKAFKRKKKFPEKMVLFLGRITGQKGPEYFLNIANKVYKDYKEVRFVVAGNGDKLKFMIEDGAFKQLGHRIHFTGFITRDKVHELLAMTDVYCMPSISEPFGLTALEAAQFNVPVVLSERSGVAEVLTSALSADFWDVDKMADHIVSLLKDDKLHQQKVTEAQTELADLNWGNAAAKVFKAYQKILNVKKQLAVV